MIVIGRAGVEAHLDHATCIALMRDAMIALSAGRTRQLLRGIIELGDGNMFGVMPGAREDGFGAKLIAVFPGQPHSHQGVLTLFDTETGKPAALIHAGAVTAIRTAAASAAATDALARPASTRLAILGTGEQAWHHALAMQQVRDLREIAVWGRHPAKAAAFADRLGPLAHVAATVRDASAGADIICTVSGAAEPILFSADVQDGTHINVVGSSRAGPVEIDTPLVARSRFFADHREGVLKQGAEFLVAKAEGAVTDDHVLGEIGEVFAGTLPGRTSDADVTIYKSLGSIVQDLACGAWLVKAARERGFGVAVDFD